ncbi:TetR/AcrR family transcriptional regulator [Peterkaempfera bronchialis]|uniref:TetR family transcriptional regulator n=1 Tax=Peterkaempfera bronchialis TaxID=2126346 RepID=A0A345T5D9_9ACTN|nr:TetR/AcrR family transcriptional regulator [Peterkaempfera bronchialis]AXI81194.1 TetR family transcriptional regulator [Peterkaempfera bronchialis]
MAAIAEHGLAKLTMAGLGRQVGMSGGHLLYYFGSKDQLLLETLRWSEEQLGERRREVLGRTAVAARVRLAEYADLYLPDGPGDPRWTLWIEVWGRSLGGEEMRGGQVAIEEPWHRDLVALLEEGSGAGEFGPVDAEAAAVRIRALLDGFSTPIAIGLPGVRREESLAHIAAVLDTLLAGG